MIRRNSSEEDEEVLRAAFSVIDKDNNGFITSADLRYVIECLDMDISEETVEDMIKEADEDGNGKVGVEGKTKKAVNCSSL